ncbi:MAG: acetyl-CoA carboxylase biotin carboxyl carrier protein [Alphaproteobacteria bacterium]
MAKFDIDANMVRKLAALLTETGLNEIEYAEDERRIRLTRATPNLATVPVVHASSAAGLTTAPGLVASADSAAAVHANAVTSPMVGTAYLSSEPGKPPFVKVGDQVKAGDTLLIIEAMKVMNPIKATAPGIVREVLVADAKPVEFGEALMIIA